MNDKKIELKKEQGNRLKITRDYLGITQEEFGKTVGLKWSQVKDRELGTTEIKLYLAIEIEKKHGINKNWLLTGEGDMFVQNNSIREQSAYYNSGNTFSPEITGTDAIDNFSELMGMAGAVLNSGTIYADALSQNIRAFHHGVNNEIDPGRKRKTLPGHPPGVVDGGRKKASG